MSTDFFAGTDEDFFTIFDVDGRDSLGHAITVAWKSLTVDMTYEHFASIVLAMGDKPADVAQRLNDEAQRSDAGEVPEAPETMLITTDFAIRFLPYKGIEYVDLGYDKLAGALAPVLAAVYGGHYLRADNRDWLYHNSGMSHEAYRHAIAVQLADVPVTVLTYGHDDYLPRKAQVIESMTNDDLWFPVHRIVQIHGRFYVTDGSNRVLEGPFATVEEAKPRLVHFTEF